MLDPDLAATEALTVKLTCSSPYGAVTLAPTKTASTELAFVQGSGAGDRVVEVRGTLRAVNAAIRTITYVQSSAEKVGPAAAAMGGGAVGAGTSILVEVEDAHGLSASHVISLRATAVNAAPRLTVPGVAHSGGGFGSDDEVMASEGDLDASAAVFVGEDSSVLLPGLSVADDDLNDTPNGYLDVTLTACHGGVLEVQTVTSTATHVNAIQTVTTASGDAAENVGGGTFRLEMDLTSIGGSSATTNLISWDAPSSTQEEVGGSSVGVAGSGFQHGSIESRLNALPNLQALGVTVELDRPPETAGDGR